MNNDMFAAIMAMYIITSALCGIFLLTLADTINPMIIGLNVLQNLFKKLFFNKNILGIIIGTIVFIVLIAAILFLLVLQVMFWIVYGFMWLYRKGAKK